MGGMTTEAEKALNEALIEILSRYFTSNAQILGCKEEILRAVEEYVQDTLSGM